MKRNIITATILLVVFGSGFYGGNLYNQKQHEADLVVKDKNMSDIVKTWGVLEDNFIYPLSEKQKESMRDGAIQGMMSKIDPHSTWWNKENQENLSNKLKGEYGGVGIRYVFDKKDKSYHVLAVKQNSPADKAGIKSGDILLKVNGIGADNADFINGFKGVVGTEIDIEFSHEKTIKTVKVKRENIESFGVYSTITSIGNSDWLTIRITDFQETTVNEVAGAIRNNWYKLDKDNNGIIIDLRGSPGGLVDVSSGVASLFLQPHKNVVNIETRNTEKMVFDTVAYPSEAWTRWAKEAPIIIWTDKTTASAAEILVAALKENNRVKFTLGSTTFGKGSVQTTLPISDNEKATLTVGFYTTPKKHYLQWHGVVPDIELVYPSSIQNALNKVSEKSMDASLAPPVESHDSKAKVALRVSQEDFDNKSGDVIYTDKTEEAINKYKL